jgi:hypothetical protein
MKNRLLLDGILLILFYVFWFTLASSPEEFHSKESWLSPQGLGSYLVGYGLVIVWAWLSPRLWRFRFVIAGTLVCLIALLVWWRGTGHSGSILPFLDKGRLSGGFLIGCVITWCHWAKGQSERERPDP